MPARLSMRPYASLLRAYGRLRAALTIRSLIREDMNAGSDKTYILVVEHDLAVLDYLSDFICCLYGTPSAYGVVTMPFSVREGINIFLAGFVPTENLRFRDEALTFKVNTPHICFAFNSLYVYSSDSTFSESC